jgi:hypothetical protein
MGESISIEEFLYRRMVDRAFEGPLTDCEGSDCNDTTGGHDDGPLLPPSPGGVDACNEPLAARRVVSNPSQLTRAEKAKQRATRRRSLK